MKAIRLLGVSIADVTAQEAVETALHGGLILAPSAPGLCDLAHDREYRRALHGSTLNLPDSGLAILLTRVLGMGCLHRTSGLGFLKQLLHSDEFKNVANSFWVMPNRASLIQNTEWLRTQSLPVKEQDCYIAPLYPKRGTVEDPNLLELVMKRRPAFIFLCTGSGTQEKLGYWLSQNLPYRPAICCIGAAIGFLSGNQTHIPSWGDRFCIGWLLRCLSNPRIYVPRYLKALSLIPLVLKYRDQDPLSDSPSGQPA